jgi:SAM-dependent methyltransferase
MSLTGILHKKLIYNRRMNVLSARISSSIPENARVLDIGCGDGKIDWLIKQNKPSLNIEGIDVLVRNETFIRVTGFNGSVIPFPDKCFDVSLLIDVLHHTDHPSVLLKEAARVTKDVILVKDHAKEGILAGPTLKLMDYAGNAHHNVRLPFNYLTLKEWQDLFKETGLKIIKITTKLGLYPIPLTYFFDRDLHVFVILKRDNP